LNIKIRDKAPEFTGTAENGEKISLADFKGKKVVLFFYPKDMTLNCTIEACNLRDKHFELREKGIEIIGISAGNEQRLEEFKDMYDLPFPLIADTDKTIINTYGVWGSKRLIGIPFKASQRTTVLIDELGRVEAIIEKVRSGSHTQQILELTNKYQ